MGALSIGLLEGDRFSPPALGALAALGSVAIWNGTQDLDVFLRDKDVLFVRLAHQIDKAFLSRCNNLKYLCSPTTGLNHIDLEALRERQVRLLSLRGEKDFLKTIRATPEHILGLTIALLRNYATAFIKERRDWDRDRFVGEEIYQNTVGLIGYGRIGKILRASFEALGATVYACDIDPAARDGSVRFLPGAAQLIDTCRIVILVASFIPQQGAIIDCRLIDRLQGKYFINAARGELVDEAHMLKRLRQGWFKGVAVDVVRAEAEPPNIIAELLDVVRSGKQNLIVTPHIGGATFTSMRRTEEFLCEKLALSIKKGA